MAQISPILNQFKVLVRHYIFDQCEERCRPLSVLRKEDSVGGNQPWFDGSAGCEPRPDSISSLVMVLLAW